MNGSHPIFVCVLLLALIFTFAHAQQAPNKYTTQDVQNLLNGKKQHMQQVESAMMETNILVDASNIHGKQSSLYATYSNEKSSSLKELSDLSKSLQYEIENLQKMVQEKKVKDETDAKILAEKKAKEEAERLVKEKKAKEEAEAKLEAEKKVKEAELKSSIGNLSTSTILTEAESKRLVSELVNDVRSRPITLCYRASQGGFDPSTFHTNCDNKGATITIAKSSSGAVYGGYTSISWNGPQSTYLSDPKAFIFSIHGPQTKNRFKKFKIQSPSSAIYTAKNYHPTFGGGHDIFLGNDGNRNRGYHNPHSYTSPDNELLDVKYPTYFTTLDYEVYLI